jgi:hypothetical protein
VEEYELKLAEYGLDSDLDVDGEELDSATMQD